MMQSETSSTLRNTAILIVGLFLFWELAYLVVGDVALRSPKQTVLFLDQLMRTDLFWLHLADSMKAFAIALAIAVSLGLLIGFALGLHRLSGDAMEPMLVALYSIPKITLYPIILLAFGIGISAKIAFGAIHGIIPVALFTLSAVRTTKPILIKTGRVLKLSPAGMVREILFPAAAPEIFRSADASASGRPLMRAPSSSAAYSRVRLIAICTSIAAIGATIIAAIAPIMPSG